MNEKRAWGIFSEWHAGVSELCVLAEMCPIVERSLRWTGAQAEAAYHPCPQVVVLGMLSSEGGHFPLFRSEEFVGSGPISGGEKGLDSGTEKRKAGSSSSSLVFGLSVQQSPARIACKFRLLVRSYSEQK